MAVFDKIAAPRLDLYDSQTNEYYGRATFAAAPDVENGLLQIINHAGTPASIVIQNVTFFPSSSGYVPPEYFERRAQKGIFRADFRDADSQLWMLADIFVTFDTWVRGKRQGDAYLFDSVQFTNIAVQDIRILPHGILGAR